MNQDFKKAYISGNAYMWGRLKGDGFISGISNTIKHGSQFNKYRDDPGFKEFFNASTTPEKVAVVEKYFGEEVAFTFGDYEMEDWDEHFRRHNAVLPDAYNTLDSFGHGTTRG